MKKRRAKRRQITVVLTDQAYDIYEKVKGTYRMGNLISILLEKWYKEIYGGKDERDT